MPSAVDFAAAMGRFGVGEGSRVILYSTTMPQWAARAWWVLRNYGFDDAAVLNGGFKKWTREGRPVETGPARPRAALPGLPVVPDDRKGISRRGIPPWCKIGSRAMRRDREHKLDLADIGGETDAATHASTIAWPRRKPQRLPTRSHRRRCSQRRSVRRSGTESSQTLCWREMDSNFRFLVVRPSNRHGRRDCCLENGSGFVGEPKVRIHLPPAGSPVRT
jgi:hypothetical protein